MQKLDLNNEFVASVCDSKTDPRSMDRCIELLKKYEEKHGVTLIAPGLKYSFGETEGIEVIRDPRVGQLVDPDEQQLENLIRQKLYPFLSDTHAVIAPSYPEDFDTAFSDRYFFHGTARAIATIYAKWATSEKWLGKSNWQCADLYYSQSLSADVYDWVQTLYSIVVVKCLRSPRTSV